MEYNKDEFEKYLKSFVDEKYAEFSGKIGIGKLKPIGVRVPKLREIAKDLSKSNWQEFFDLQKNDSTEIITLKGLCLGYAKVGFDEFLLYLTKFFEMVESWAETDISASSFKIIKKNLQQTYNFVLPYLFCEEEYKVRLAVIILLDYFLCDEWVDDVLCKIQKIQFGKYYIDMAVAWLLSVSFVKFREKTLSLLEKKSLPKFVQNKAIQKCKESFRVLQEDKTMLETLKI